MIIRTTISKALLLVAIAMSLVAAACNSDNPSSPGGVGSLIKAKKGNTYTYDAYSTDSTNAVIPGSRDTVVSTVLDADFSFGGKSGVLVVEDRSSSNRDTSYYAYEANNNISVAPGLDSAGNARWMTLPIATGSPITMTSVDSADFFGIPAVFRVTQTLTREGEESVLVKGNPIAAVKIKLNLHGVITIAGVPGSDTSSDTFLYVAPSLGFLIKLASQSRKDPTAIWIPGNYQVLIDYNLK